VSRLAAILSLVLAAAACLPACSSDLDPYGEALIVMQTDTRVPERVNRVRIDVHAADGALLSSRELSTPSARDWPLSFSVVADAEAERLVTVRIRAFPEGHVAPVVPVRVAAEPTAYASIDAACVNAPVLRLGERLVLRRGSVPITTVLPFTPRAGATAVCTEPTNAGSAVAKLEVTEKAEYDISVVESTPDGALNEVGSDTTLAIRGECPFPTSQVACSDPPMRALPSLRLTLAPGVVWIITGGSERAPADLTLLATKVGEASQVPAPPPAPPALVEPAPGATLDRLVRLRLLPGRRGTVRVTLHGECFGRPANVTTNESCISDGSVLVADVLSAESALIRSAPPVPPWTGDDPRPCTVTPRGPSALRDEEVCIPGGAFLMGDTLALTDLELKTQPERVRVVEPFLLDKFEFTVARYREALRRGFVPIPGSIIQNDAAFKEGVAACTFADPARFAGATARDAFPLNCITWEAARALCKFFEEDLPTEDQLEYAATAAGRSVETQFPWGDDLPDCDRVVSDRSDIGLARDCKTPSRYGPLAVDAEPYLHADVSPQGVVGLGGNVAEWTSTAFYSYDHPAWTRTGPRSPLSPAAERDAPRRSLRGGDWASFALFATGSARRARPVLTRDEAFGFRCARAGR
jgi:formylglycine-generating enzyme required for sulfatase activity